MKTLNEKLDILKSHIDDGYNVMIMGLGSVGEYLLDYLLSSGDEKLTVTAVGRNRDKLMSDVNIVKIASCIRGQNKSKVDIVSDVDFNDVDRITEVIRQKKPDIIVNSSRAYSGLKYGSISWKNIRAYGIWTPLSIKYIKNIMAAYEKAGSDAIVINTSYSDAVIPWLKSAGQAYPDFGSGNINHLIPRIKLAVAAEMGIDDFYNIDITYAVAHFHDVVISKEGQTEGVKQLIKITYRGKRLDLDMDKICAECNIPMPVDAKRNMMNASSNYEIIKGIVSAVRDGKRIKFHCPGVFGEIGGYPTILESSASGMKAYIDESAFTLDEMRKKNRESIYLDGIENVVDGKLVYTDELLEKVKKVFGANLPKYVKFDDIEDMANFIISEIIEKYMEK